MEVAKLLYIVVEDDFGGDEEKEGNEELSFRYTRHVLQSTLQLMGCKARHAFKVHQFHSFFLLWNLMLFHYIFFRMKLNGSLYLRWHPVNQLCRKSQLLQQKVQACTHLH